MGGHQASTPGEDDAGQKARARLDGKTLLITGAARGLGRAAAVACAHAGARLVLCDVGCDPAGQGTDPAPVEALCAELASRGCEAVASALDVTLDGAPDALVQLATARFGRLDAVFAAAGIVREQPLSRLSDADLDRVLDVHARAAIRLTRSAVAQMQAQAEGGSIVLSTGQAAFVGQRGHTAYCAAASAVTGFVRAAAVELRRHHVRINALSALARTRATEALPMFQSLRADSLTPEQVGNCVAFLVSPLAQEISGECIGAAGNRLYTLRMHETTGAFLEDATLAPESIAQAWAQIARP
jgi:NAD(P)-dependent dehydrogenase (short-subunit alcohol dehydrogenase family)